jgi:hypothetical protein
MQVCHNLFGRVLVFVILFVFRFVFFCLVFEVHGARDKVLVSSRPSRSFCVVLTLVFMMMLFVYVACAVIPRDIYI